MHIKKIHLISSNLDAQAHFFAEILLLPTERKNDCLTVKVGTSQLVFQQGQVDGHYHYAFDIPQNQFDEAVAWLRARGVSILADCTGKQLYHHANINAHAVYFRDTDGNIGELIARRNLQTERLMTFDETSLLWVSEIGLATPHVIDTVEALKAQGIPVWRGHGSETFTMMGNEYGLLIVVQQERFWLPTHDTPALAIPTQIMMHGIKQPIRLDGLPYTIEGTPQDTFSTNL